MTRVLPDDVAKELGMVVAEFARLEHELHSLIHLMLSDEQRIGMIVTTELRSFQGMLSLLSALLRYRMPGRIDELHALLRRVETAEARRNVLLHSIWAAGTSPDQSSRLKATIRRRSGWDLTMEPINADRLHQDAKEFRQITNELIRFRFSLHGTELPEDVNFGGGYE